NDTAFVANLAPIKVDGKITGAIFSCQELKRIEAIGSEIWRNSLRNGFVAHYRFQMMQEPSSRILQTITQAKLYAQSVSPILICNEVGGEHDLFAQSIHNESPRKNAPYVSTECSQMEPAKQLTLLFGISDSKNSNFNQKGLIANAHEGTIFLKNIENLCMEGQYRLKVLLKEHLLILDGDVGPLRLDVRIIAETSADLPTLVESGVFDMELYYALNVLYLKIPPLREREEDILYWVEKYVIKFREQYGRFIVLTNGAKNFLMKYKWPGNLLQLKQFCDRLVLCASRRSVDEIYIESLLDQMYPALRNVKGSDSIVVYKAPEAARISEILNKKGGNRTAAAKELGMSKTTLWRKIKKFNISDEN
ncbi:MAG: diguanylate cyclase, partial [Sphingobacteriia bacterium]|nr:diguanylate cyclase [Sphingobacteriia bacterium]